MLSNNSHASKLSLTLICLFLSSACSLSHLYLKQPALSWSEFDVGNKAATLKWQGNCSISADGIIELVGQEQTNKTCISSEFEVIPGHYDFWVDFKAQDLDLSSARMLTEALSIRLLASNSAGQISQYDGFLGQQIDVSQLNYALNRVDADKILPPNFTKLSLIPRFHPYDSGWLKNGETKARIEIQFNAPGKVYFKNFHFAYSRWNFSLYERVKHLVLTEAEPRIFPQPQRISAQMADWTVAPSSVCIDTIFDHETVRKAIAQFENSLNIESTLIRKSCSPDQMIIQIKRVDQSRVAHTEGYNITPQTTSDKFGFSIEVQTPRGAEYALRTLRQLFEQKSVNLLHIKAYKIEDYPSVGFRAVSSKDPRGLGFSQELRAMDWLAESRLNSMFLEIDTHNLAWWAPHFEILDTFRRLKQESAIYGLVDVGIMLNPYIHLQDETLNNKGVTLSNQTFVRQIDSVLRSFNSDYLILRTDDFVPRINGEKFGYYLADAQDQKKYASLANAHFQLIRAIRAHNPKMKLYFVPPWYNNIFADLSFSRGWSYLKELGSLLPSDVPLMWTGPTVRSLQIDDIQARRFLANVNKKRLVLWDNTLYARKLKDFWGEKSIRRHLNSDFEPYSVSLPLESISGVFANAQTSEFYRIQLATYGAYLWNPNAYDPEKDLWSYLKLRFGVDLALKLLEFDSYRWDRSIPVTKFTETYNSLENTLSLKDKALLDEIRDAYSYEMRARALAP